MKNTLNQRQQSILAILEKSGGAPVRKIVAELKGSAPAVSPITVKRDMARLLAEGFVTREGKGRAVTYRCSPRYNLLRPIDPEAYFRMEDGEREAKERFDMTLFETLAMPFSESELSALAEWNETYSRNVKHLPANARKAEFERLVIELSWKSSRIEGNTYSLLETEALILQHEEAEGHSKKETVMILNHKHALDFLREDPKYFKTITVRKIEEIHTLLIQGLGVPLGLRKTPVGIVGTPYRPLDNVHQILEAMEKMCKTVNAEKNPFAKSIIAGALIAYIQPFADGNKRTSRILGNALLMAYEKCPLSYRSASEIEYKKAVILFYEQNNLSYFKKLFIQQFRYAVENYFVA